MARCGVDPKPVFNGFGLYESDLQNTNKRCHAYIEVALWHSAQQLINEPCLGLHSAKGIWHPSHMGVLGYAWLASETLESALQRLNRFQYFITNAYRFSLHQQHNQYRIKIHYSVHNPALQARSESILSTLLCMCKINFGEHLKVQNVSFIHTRPLNITPYLDVFACIPEFSTTYDSISFTLSDVQKKLAANDYLLIKMLDQLIAKALHNLDRHDIVSEVQSIILEQLPSAKVTEEDVADLLNMSKRKLQLKLANKNARYKKLLDDIRLTKAQQFLNEKELSLNEIAFLLGYSEVSSFSRAFKRWTGIAPGQYKKNS